MNFTPTVMPVQAGNNDSQQAVLLAAETVLATLLGRAPNRVVYVSLAAGIQYAVSPDYAALQVNRGLLEDVVMVQLATHAARLLLGGMGQQGGIQQSTFLQENIQLNGATKAGETLVRSLTQPEERAVVNAYLQVLLARATALLRSHWAEVQVVAAGLSEVGELNGEAVRWRMDCAQGIRGKLLN